MSDAKRKIIAEALENIIEKARNGGPVVKVGLMASGSELGQAEVLSGGLLAQAENPSLRVVAIGPKPSGKEAEKLAASGLNSADLEWVETPYCEADVAAAVEKALADRNSEMKVADFQAIDERRRALLGEVEVLKGERNKASAEIAKIKRSGGNADELMKSAGELGERSKALDLETA